MFEFDVDSVVVVDRLGLSLFTEITKKLEMGEFSDADKHIELVFTQDKIWDSRYLIYYLFSQLAQYKFVNYIEFAEHSTKLFSVNYVLISPSHHKDKIIQKSIEWFDKYFMTKFEQILQLFPDEEKINEVCEKTLALLDSMSHRGYETKKMQIKMNKFSADIARKLNINKTEVVLNEVNNNEKNLDRNNDNQTCLGNTDIKNITPSYDSAKPKAEDDTSTFSVEWGRLVNLLNDYNYYMDSGHVEVAYLAHLKIENIIGDFDPSIYFPKIFKSYLRSKVHNYAKIYNLEQQEIERLPYANLINGILDNHDPSLRKIICEKQFEYLVNDNSSDSLESDNKNSEKY